MRSVIWLRRDLRVLDNPALAAAFAHDEVHAIYIEPTDEPWPTGGAQKWYIGHSLLALQKQLAEYGVKLSVQSGNTVEILKDYCVKHQIDEVFINRLYTPNAIRQEQEVAKSLSARVQFFKDFYLFAPDEITNKTGGPYKVYTPFSKTCLALLPREEPLKAPRKHGAISVDLEVSFVINKLFLSGYGWWKKLVPYWQPGAEHALKELRNYCKSGAMPEYHKQRDLPDTDGTSQLGVCLALGELSPRQVISAIRSEVGDKWNAGTSTFVKQILWREFAGHLLWHFPHTDTMPLRPEFEKFPWYDDEEALKVWQRGETGYPIVDAGMRQLWETGWMHNRVRMIVASFLIKDLLIPWQKGAEWFWDTLVDADLANNTLGWQWTAGCGADAAPFFRIFNPSSQAERFDPKGGYIKKWVPELRDVPAVHLSAPQAWLKANKKACHYPEPMVEHAKARALALQAYERIKGAKDV
jgi:deoxyribodipyrimidine photo-lyase